MQITSINADYTDQKNVAISRIEYKIQESTCPERDIYVCNDDEYGKYFSDLSSTSIRDEMRKGSSIDGLTYDSVVKYFNEYVH